MDRILRAARLAFLVTTLGACGATASSLGPEASTPASPSTVHASPLASATDGSCVSGADELVPGHRGTVGHPGDLAREALAGLQASDVITSQPVDALTVRVSVVREGREVGALSYVSDANGGWSLGEWQLCEGLAVR